jgi:hypothetical protein
VTGARVKFLVMIYPNPELLASMPEARFSATMRSCLEHADNLRRDGRLLDTQMLQPAHTAKSLRTKDGKVTVVDGPFAETKEVLGGFNVIEAASIDEAIEIARAFPWTDIGCVEVRPILEVDDMRDRVGAPRYTMTSA